MENSNLDYNKFSEEYERLMDQLEDFELSGGGKKKVSTDSDEDVTVEEVDSKSIQVGCVNITQKRDGFNFDGRICKTPKIRIKLRENEVPLTKVVKVLLRYVNKRLRMSNIESVEMIKGKKKTKYDGDKLSEKVSISDMGDLDEVNIKMN